MSDGQAAHSSDGEQIDTSVLDIQGDKRPDDDEAKRLNVSGLEMWALGTSISIGGLFFAWNVGLAAGFGSYIIARVFMSGAFIALAFCIAELSSGLPFAGAINM